MASIAPPPPEVEIPPTTITIDNETYPIVEICSTGDVLLDVSFENTNACNKSIPVDLIRKLKTSKSPIPSPRIFYRVRLDTLKKSSDYFKHLLGPSFAEGAAVIEAFEKLSKSGLNPTEIDAELLPRIEIVDEDVATKTLGREVIFGDMLRIIHGAEHTTKPIMLNILTVLVVMADRYSVLSLVSRYFQKTFKAYKYPATLDKKAEEILRQKILVFYHTEQSLNFCAATRELILRGSLRWTGAEETTGDFQTAWWDLPDGLEAELAHRRACVLRTIASIQTQCLTLYSSRDLQCKLGYESSHACDSFQLGEMIKFLTRKGLLSLIPFQAVSPEDDEYIWPEAYSGDAETLMGLLRQCPGYQVNEYHKYCGLRTKLLGPLEYIKSCIEVGVGISLGRGKNWMNESWIPSPSSSISKTSFSPRKAFTVGTTDEEDTFDYATVKNKTSMMGLGGAKAAKELFTQKKWNWVMNEERGGIGFEDVKPTLRPSVNRGFESGFRW
ncbi:hypothetical protein HYALB_00009135 [Hymenoscyphus albidus]|uniref:BTB domain-containing protein n=1 Tax=Hymenoscyphus albidus TaxID=595503 RepID=A0A9N9PX91_9HELO|nr:hypothetical protein HYALB_00009135 [Hymenoscyphus albidus]